MTRTLPHSTSYEWLNSTFEMLWEGGEKREGKKLNLLNSIQLNILLEISFHNISLRILYPKISSIVNWKLLIPQSSILVTIDYVDVDVLQIEFKFNWTSNNRKNLLKYRFNFPIIVSQPSIENSIQGTMNEMRFISHPKFTIYK